MALHRSTECGGYTKCFINATHRKWRVNIYRPCAELYVDTGSIGLHSRGGNQIKSARDWSFSLSFSYVRWSISQRSLLVVDCHRLNPGCAQRKKSSCRCHKGHVFFYIDTGMYKMSVLQAHPSSEDATISTTRWSTNFFSHSFIHFSLYLRVSTYVHVKTSS